jgi:hypothetical protein
MKRVLALAALAAIGFAGAAYAGDATAPKAMSDSEMDKVTAAGGPNTLKDINNPGVIGGVGCFAAFNDTCVDHGASFTNKQTDRTICGGHAC